MIEEDIDTSLKVIVVGNGEVGKTSLITRFARGVFTGDYKKTLAVDFLEKKCFLPQVDFERGGYVPSMGYCRPRRI